MLKGLLGGIVTLLSPLSYHSLAKLLVTAQDDAQDEVPWMLRDLHAILDIPKDSSRLLHLHHPSFRDFLFEKARSEEFWVDEKQMHQVLADRCISLMSTSLKQGMCGEDALGILVAELERSQIKRSLPPEVQYACLHWIQHLQKSDTQFNDIDKVHQFLQDHLLHWLEALGWMGKLSEGVHAIASLKSFAAVSTHLLDILTDTSTSLVNFPSFRIISTTRSGSSHITGPLSSRLLVVKPPNAKPCLHRL
jgi:hypothetical protein